MGEKVSLSAKGPPLESVSVELDFLHQAKFFGTHSSGGHSPEVGGQAPRQGHNGFLAGGPPEASPILEQRSPAAHSTVVWLKAAHPPGQFHHQVAQTWVTVLGDRPQASSLVARAFTRTEPKVVGHLAAVAETLWVNQLAGQELVSELALPKDQPARSSRSQLAFNFAQLLLDGFD
jgi:hypothetical protein